MTIASEVRKAGPYEGNDLATTFPFDFKVFSESGILVTYGYDEGFGAIEETVLKLDVDYSVTLNPDQEANAGGYITYPIGGQDVLSAGEYLTFTGNEPYEQPTAITNQGGFYPRVIEDALDRVVIQIQQLQEMASRALLIPVSGGIVAGELLDYLAEQLPKVQAVYDHLAQVIAVADNQPNIDTVADNIDNVNLTGTYITDISLVSAKLDDVITAALNILAITTTADSIDNVNAVGASIDDVNTTAANIDDVNTVAGIEADVQTVSSIEQQVQDVVAIKQNIQDILDIQAEVVDVSDIKSEVVNTSNHAVDIKRVSDDLNGLPLVLDMGEITDPATNPVRPTGVLGAVWSNEANITITALNIAAIKDVSDNLQTIIDALQGGLRPSNNLSDLESSEQALVHLGLRDMGNIS